MTDYAGYLKVRDLLALQQPISDGPAHDELLFIVVHQVSELWFKLVLHELDRLRDQLEDGDAQGAVDTLRRLRTVWDVLGDGWKVLETMTPESFAAFRGPLQGASGFQSVQFRELEFVLGRRDDEPLHQHPAQSAERQRLMRRLTEPPLNSAFLTFLEVSGHDVPRESVEAAAATPGYEDPRIQQVLVRVYRHDPAARAVCEGLLDLDEALQDWRYRHVKLVERQIGAKTGTGGSSGVDYLRTTLFRPVFPDLWAVRNEL